MKTKLITGIKQWLEGIGIDTQNAERYSQVLTDPTIDSVSQLIANPLDNDDLKTAGVNNLRHRKIIIDAIQGN